MMTSTRMTLIKSRFCYSLLIFCILLLFSDSSSARKPEFDLPLPNLTAKEGSSVSFVCVVKHLGEYKVAWIKLDNKAILAWHTHMVTHNPRFSVTHNGHNTWTLHIKELKQNDTGNYMCQINTEPQISLTGGLEVVVPADIIDEETSNDVVVSEGQSTILKCKARGYPAPKVKWKRQDGQPLPISREYLKKLGGEKGISNYIWEGETLPLSTLRRMDTGSYLCIANNSIPPIKMKRVQIYVHCHPLIKVESQLVAAPINLNLTLSCYVEAVPNPFISWSTKQGHLIMNSDGKYQLETEKLNNYALKMKLTIAYLKDEDFTDYNCSAANSLGHASGTIKLQKIIPPVTLKPTPTTTQRPTKKHSNSEGGGGENRFEGREGRKNHRKKSHGQTGLHYGVDDYSDDLERTSPSSIASHSNVNNNNNNNRLGNQQGQDKKGMKNENNSQFNPNSNPSWKNGKNIASSYYYSFSTSFFFIFVVFLFHSLYYSIRLLNI